jgi:hypothetical protein
MNEISSVSEFLNILEKLPRKSGSSLYYRGHSNSDYLLEPSLFRKKNWLAREHLMYNELLKEHPESFIDDRTTLEKLVKMQHYGLPTRLLDITKDPLVALYFACATNDKIDSKQDSEVIVLSIRGKLMKYNDSDTVAVLSNLCKLKKKEKRFNTNLPETEFNKQDNVIQLLWQIKQEKPIFYNIIDPKDINSIVPVKVKKNSDRIKRQDGLFLLFGADGGSGKLEVPSDWIIKGIKGSDERIIIRGKEKGKIKKQLEKLNISNYSLFPDLENCASSIKRNYS